MTALDFDFLNWNVVSGFILKGLFFSIQLTLIAMVGGIVIGTVLALMRLSGKKWLVLPAAAYVNTLRSIPLVMVILWFFLLIPLLIGRPMGAELSAIIAEKALLHLEAPIARVAGLDTPFPYTLELEYLPSPERVTKAIAETARF